MSQNESLKDLLDGVRWDADGLAPCVVQDVRDGAVLMVAYMNRDSLARTLKEGRTCFWSRSRKKFWLKGEESGNIQVAKEVYVDCDQDCILVKVRQIGNAACHTGMRSCFYRKIDKNGKITVKGKRVFDPAKVYVGKK